MTYHSLPRSLFQRVSEPSSLARWKPPGQDRPGYFYLTKLAAPAPQRTATAALTHTTKSTTPKQH